VKFVLFGGEIKDNQRYESGYSGSYFRFNFEKIRKMMKTRPEKGFVSSYIIIIF